MIDKKFLRENKELVIESLKKRGMTDIDVEKIISLDLEVKTLDEKIDRLRNERKTGSKTKPNQEEIKALQLVREKIGKLENKKKGHEEKLFPLLASIPNFLHESVPEGETEDDNVLIEEVGDKTKFDFDVKPHHEIESIKNMIDVERGVKVSGTRFYYLKDKVALLERALMNYAADFIIKKDFQFVLPPLMVKEHALFGTGYFPNGRNEVYAVNPEEDDLYLIGTSEQSLMAMHFDEILDDVPLKYAGFSPCFRREAGSYGKDTKGIVRVHQFYKTEMLALVAAEKSWKVLDEFVKISKEFCKTLKVPFRIMGLCAGDTGVQAAKTIDFEAWFPSQKKYREIGSASNTTDYQTRRLKIRTKKNNKTELVHSINNTVAADRLLLAILENNQQKDGSVLVPKVLQSYCGFDKIK